MTVARPSWSLEHGSYRIEAPCPGCGVLDGWRCYPGRFPTCWRCGVTVVKYGKTPDADCVTPNGRIDGHMSYAKGSGKLGETICAFCGKV